MKQLLTATALSTLLLIGCSQEGSNPTPESSNKADISTEIEATPDTTKIDVASLPDRKTGSVQIDGFLVTGYAMSQPTGIRTVEVLINGEPAGIATYKINRPLHKQFDDFYDPNKPNVGFKYTINPEKLTSGEYDVSIRATTVDGQIFTFGQNKTFTVE